MSLALAVIFRIIRSMNAIELENVTKCFGKHHPVDDLSLCVPAGIHLRVHRSQPLGQIDHASSRPVYMFGMLFRVNVFDKPSGTFTVASLSGKQLATDLKPEKSGHSTDATRGIAYWKSDDGLGLIEVF